MINSGKEWSWMDDNSTDTKVINGKTYRLINKEWVRQRPHGIDEVDPHDPDYSWLWDVDRSR